jgi:uncharacterized SAM-binding protein YcdF (DUF218 family)
MIYLHKILPLLVSPLSIVLIIILIGTFFKSKKISLLGLLILIFCSVPIISNKLIFYLEKDYSLQSVKDVTNADAIVVLSGMISTINSKEKLSYEFNDSIDRILSGIDLFKEDKASFLILTNGKMPWSVGIPEGEYLKDFSIKYGIPEDRILLTDNVQNTDQEAISVKKLLKTNEANIILVTSAFHMPRAKKVFEAANIKVIPFAVDFKTPIKKITIIDFIPSANSLKDTSHFFREMIGRLYYNLKY